MEYYIQIPGHLKDKAAGNPVQFYIDDYLDDGLKDPQKLKRAQEEWQ